MNASRVAPVALGIVALAVLALVLASTRSDDDAYHLKMRVPNAAGLRDGSPVTMGAVPVGRLDVSLRDDGTVDLDLQIKKEHGPIGRDAILTVRAINLLGQKQLQLVSSGTPAPSGSRIPANRFTVSTDLDQVLDILDPDTRVRLGILLNEAGLAVDGRRADVTKLIAQLPGGLDDVKRVVDAVNSDNRALRRLLNDSARTVTAVDEQRDGLRAMVTTLSQMATNLASRRPQLEATLQRAPGALASLRTVLARLDQLTIPAGPAARMVAATAPELSAALAEVPAFTQAAAPTLDKATRVSDDLSRLADKATPTLRRAVPVASDVAKLTSQSLPPVTNILDKSVSNVLAILDNWSRAIQFRDQLSHVFRGSASVAPDMLDSILNRALAQKQKRARKKTKTGRGPTTKPSNSSPGRPGVKPSDALPKTAGDAIKKAADGVKNLLSPPSRTDGDSGQASVGDLLDYLLKP